MTRTISRLAALVALGAVLLLPATFDARAAGGYTAAFGVSGNVEKPGTYGLADLEKLPVTTQNVVFMSGKGATSDAWTGALLWDFLQSLGIKTNPNVKNGLLRMTVTLVATDGYMVTVGLGEIAPNFGGHQAILAYKQDGRLLGQDSGFARLVFPGDKAGGRAISSISWMHVW